MRKVPTKEKPKAVRKIAPPKEPRTNYTFTMAITIGLPGVQRTETSPFRDVEKALDLLYSVGAKEVKKRYEKVHVAGLIHWIDLGKESTAIKKNLR